MDRNKIKNFVIIALVLLAVYQSGKLWLGDTASHNFFYSLFRGTHQEKVMASTSRTLLLPGKMAVSTSSKKFSVLYANESKELYAAANQFFTEMLDAGSPKTMAEPWADGLIPGSLVMEYDFLLPILEYQIRPPQGLHSFDTLIFLPGNTPSEPAELRFFNSETQEGFALVQSRSQSAAALTQALSQSDSGLMYVSTAQSGFHIFEKNIFVPQWADSGLFYFLLQREFPYESEGTPSLTLLENSVENFFQNFGADWHAKEEDGSFLFSDESVVVKYHPKEKLLAYYSYDAYKEGKTTSLIDGYQLAQNFLRTDKTLETNVTLSDIYRRGNETIYCFDYVVQGFPVILSDDIKASLSMEHAIEVGVRGETIRRYSRYACNFVTQNAGAGVLDEDFLTALNRSILTYQSNAPDAAITQVEDIYLGYAAGASSPITLAWYTNLYGQIFTPQEEIPSDTAEQ